VAGIDVGEDFLDVASFSPSSLRLNLARVDLRQVSADPVLNPASPRLEAIGLLSSMLINAAPELRGAIVLVDSPRWPRDLDWSDSAHASSRAHQTPVAARKNFRGGRQIDAALRALVCALGELGPSALATLSMFPTPPMNYFGAHLNSATCKPHLRRFGQALFGTALTREYTPVTGGIFTRFMIAGFATYQALAPFAGQVYESYPDLQFKLWRRDFQIISKNSAEGRTAALASRIRVLSALARELGMSGLPHIPLMDEADAAILALSTLAAYQQGAVLMLASPDEGSFLLGLNERQARHLKQLWSGTSNNSAVDPHYDFLEQ
jgi:Protein of unknown function (DUF429)